MWSLTYNWWEMIFRAVIIYIALSILFRVVGKKQLGEMSPFDFILLLIISEGVSGGLVGEEYSVIGALIVAASLLGINYLIDYLSYKFKKIENLVEGEAKIIIQNGKVISEVANRELITLAEIMQSLRQENIDTLEQVKFGILETSGRISIIKNEKSEAENG